MLDEMLNRLKLVMDSAYSFKDALKRQNLTQETLNLLRERLKGSKEVPQFIPDKVVSIANRNRKISI